MPAKSFVVSVTSAGAPAAPPSRRGSAAQGREGGGGPAGRPRGAAGPSQGSERAGAADELEAVRRALADAAAGVAKASGGLVFVAGGLVARTVDVAALVRQTWRGVPALIVPGAGVLSERGEIEGAAAASGVLWSGGRAAPFTIAEGGDELAGGLERAVRTAAQGARAPTVLLFPRPDAFQAQALDGLAAFAPDACLFGAGTVGGSAVAVTGAGELLEGAAAGLVVAGLAAPVVDASPACRLLCELATIDEASGGMVLRVGGKPALDLLSSAAAGIPSSSSSGAQPIVFGAIADEGGGAEGRARYSVRPVRGIDPTRRGVMIGPEARAGVRFAFAVRDATAARADLEATARRIAQQSAGAAPRFAIYLSCAGRGQALYGSADVEARILRQRFGDLPIAGMHSAFEIGSAGPGRARMELFTGVLALFRSPS